MEFIQAILKFLAEIPPFCVIYPYEAGVLFRGGNVSRELDAGIYLKWPIYDHVEKINKMEQEVDVPEQAITTCDGKVYVVSTTIRYRVEDVGLAVCSVFDYDKNIIGQTSKLVTEATAKTNSGEFTASKLEKGVV